MESVLLSVKPQYVAKILNGEKTIEIRKRPIPVGTKVYIYCTKDKPFLYQSIKNTHFLDKNGKETFYWCDKDNEFCLTNDKQHANLNGKVVASFVVSKCEKFIYCSKDITQKSCLEVDKIKNYAGKRDFLFAWHISQLHIFDKPKELEEFFRLCNRSCNNKCKYFNGAYCQSDLLQITKAPQSYCYVEELE